MSHELEKFKNNDVSNEIFPEHAFISSCLRIGLSINDLEKMTYVDVMKILISFIGENKDSSGNKNATQSDIDKLLR